MPWPMPWPSGLAAHAPEVIVGLPTLGLALAERDARLAGHARFVACGTSRKFWYDDALSVPIRSITSPGSAPGFGKAALPRPTDAAAPGGAADRPGPTPTRSARAVRCAPGLTLLAAAGVAPVCPRLRHCARRWPGGAAVEAARPGLSDRTEGVFDSPLLALDAGTGAWRPVGPAQT